VSKCSEGHKPAVPDWFQTAGFRADRHQHSAGGLKPSVHTVIVDQANLQLESSARGATSDATLLVDFIRRWRYSRCLVLKHANFISLTHQEDIP
jgi:hypothetical protein